MPLGFWEGRAAHVATEETQSTRDHQNLVLLSHGRTFSHSAAFSRLESKVPLLFSFVGLHSLTARSNKTEYRLVCCTLTHSGGTESGPFQAVAAFLGLELANQ